MESVEGGEEQRPEDASAEGRGGREKKRMTFEHKEFCVGNKSFFLF